MGHRTRDRWTAAVWRPALALMVGLAAVFALTVVPANGGAVGVTNYKPISYEVSQQTCANLGRAWEQYEGVYGCSREHCAVSGARAIGDFDTEACVLGGVNYGENLESRACARLKRVWVPEVDRCLTNVNRGASSGIINKAPQCLKSASTYVFIAPSRGKDVCVTAPRAASYVREARQQRISVSEAAFRRSRVLCDMAPRYNFQQSLCRHLKPTQSKPKVSARVFTIGDSVTWRAADEMAREGAQWQVDGRPGTSIHSAGERYRDYIKLYSVPSVFVIALGTNGVQNERTRARFKTTAELVPKSSRVVFVTPYRDPAIYGEDRALEMEERGRWMRQVANNRPHTCIADWHQVAEDNPDLLVDGVHQNKRGAQVFVDTITKAVAACR